MIKLLQSRKGEGHVDVIVVVLCSMLLISLAVNAFPVFIAKSQLDSFAAELAREFEIAGRVGTETTAAAHRLRTQTGISPTIAWSRTGNVQINQEVTVTLTHTIDIGFFNFGSFPITLTSRVTGKSEVYWK